MPDRNPVKVLGLTPKGEMRLRLGELGVADEVAVQVLDEFDHVFRAHQGNPNLQDQRQAVFDTFDALSVSMKLQRQEISRDKFVELLPKHDLFSWTFLVNLTGKILSLYLEDKDIDPDAYIEIQRTRYYQLFDERDD